MYDVQTDNFRIRSGLMGTDYKFPKIIPESLVEFISGPADGIRLFIINDLPATDSQIKDSRIREFLMVYNSNEYSEVTSSIVRKHLIIANKGWMDSELYEYNAMTGFVEIK